MKTYRDWVLGTITELWNETDLQQAREFAQNIRHGDSFPPLLVEGVKIVHDGHHRWFALWMLGVEKFWVIDLLEQPDFRQGQDQPHWEKY